MTERTERVGAGPAMTVVGRQDCIDLLARHRIGRIAWQAADGLQILPISYAWFEEAVVFRTSPYGVLSELLRPTEVAMEIDELDIDHHRGWSVVVQGRAEAVAQPEQLVRMWTVDDVVPWAPGVRNLFIRITPRHITGRILDARPPSA